MWCRDCYRLLADCQCDFGPEEPNTEPLPRDDADYFLPPEHPLDDGTCETGEFEIAELEEDEWEPDQ